MTKAELDSKIQSVKIDISKGPQNPAHSWIRKLDYSKPSIDEGCSFYEGKKATPADIVSGFPIKRPSLEKDVINSICENMVTVIKASSGQGKPRWLCGQLIFSKMNIYHISYYGVMR
ncbi:MAG: hypothetical protein ACLRWM_13710 [Streptococcus sp.]